MSVLLLIILFVCFVFVYAFWRNQSRRFNEPPLYPGAWPVLGHIFLMNSPKKLWNCLYQMALDLPHRGGTSYVLVGPVKIYVVCDPDDSLLICNQCLDKSVYYSFGDKWIGKSLVISKSSLWRKDRKMLMPAFGHQVLGGFVETFDREAKRIVEKLSAEAGKGSFDHSPYIYEYAIETLCKSVLGVEVAEKKKYMDMAGAVLSVMVKRFMNLFFHSDTIYSWSNLKKIEDECIFFFHSVADELIEKKRSEEKEKPQSNLGTKSNFFELMLAISTREKMTDEWLRDNLNMMVVAGYDTISITMTIMLIVIGSHKNVQEKIFHEILDVLGDNYKEIEYSDYDRLVYLEAVIKESMRLYPTIPIVIREIEEDIKLAKYTLYAGNSCVLLLSGLNMHPIWGEDAQEFKPERWLHPSTVPDHPVAFAGFSIGRRNCIGKYFAMLSMKSFLVHFLRNYVVTADLTKLEFIFDILAKPEPGNHISLQKRI